MKPDITRKTKLFLSNDKGSYWVKNFDTIIPNLAVGDGFGINGNPTFEAIIKRIYTNVEFKDNGDLEIVQTLYLEEV